MPSLTGQLLVAMPQMSDPFFDHSVVYLCAHSEEDGAMGLVVNKTLDSLTIDELYAQLKIEPVTRSNRPVHFGGPVAPGQGFVLHSADFEPLIHKAPTPFKPSVSGESIAALVGLGISENQSRLAVDSAMKQLGDEAELAAVIRASLKAMGR